MTSAASIKPKYQNWFGAADDAAPQQARPQLQQSRPDTSEEAFRRIATQTTSELERIGDGRFEDFRSRMATLTPNHRMIKSIKATVLADKPQFGRCRIGKVDLGRTVVDGVARRTELQFYVANFKGTLNTDEGGDFQTPLSNEFGQNYFGVVVDMEEESGKAIGFNKDYGRAGVMFHTEQPRDALIFMSAFASGKTPQEVAKTIQEIQAASGK